MHYSVWRDDPLFPFLHAYRLAGVAVANSMAHSDYKDFNLADALVEFGLELLPNDVPSVDNSVDQMAILSALDPVATEQWYRDRDERDEARLAEAENDKKMRAIIEAEQLAKEANALQVEIDVINEPDPTGDEDLEHDWWEIIGRATMAGVTGLSTRHEIANGNDVRLKVERDMAAIKASESPEFIVEMYDIHARVKALGL